MNTTAAKESNVAASTAVKAPEKTPTTKTETPEPLKYTETQFQAQRGQIQSEYQKQVNVATLKATTLESELATARSQIDILKAEVDNPYTEETLKTAATKHREANIALAKKELEVNGLKAKLWKEDHDRYADTLTERFGKTLDEEGRKKLNAELKALESQDDMNNHIIQNHTAVTLPAAETLPSSQTQAPKLPPPPIPNSGQVGMDTSKMTPREKIRLALEQENNGG